MDKLRRVLSGQEDNEERGLTEQVDPVWHLRNNMLMLILLKLARITDILQSAFNFLLSLQHSTALSTNKIICIILTRGGFMH